MLITLTTNILDITDGIICQQVNCKLVMGAGLAKQIREKYPVVYNVYKNRRGPNLGDLLIVPVSKELSVACLYAQYSYGRYGKFTDYFAFETCLMRLKESNIHNKQIYFPYKIGCGLGGGDWRIIEKMIKRIIPDSIIVGGDE